MIGIDVDRLRGMEDAVIESSDIDVTGYSHAASDQDTDDNRIVIREYRSEDHAALLALWAEADLHPFTEPEVERLIASGGGALVAESWDTAAFAASGVLAGTLFWSHNGHIALFWKLAVRSRFRQRGVARRLMARAESDISDAGLAGVALLTHSSNVPARCLYKSQGWTHRAHNEYWTKRLKPPMGAPHEEKTSC